MKAIKITLAALAIIAATVVAPMLVSAVTEAPAAAACTPCVNC